MAALCSGGSTSTRFPGLEAASNILRPPFDPNRGTSVPDGRERVYHRFRELEAAYRGAALRTPRLSPYEIEFVDAGAGPRVTPLSTGAANRAAPLPGRRLLVGGCRPGPRRRIESREGNRVVQNAPTYFSPATPPVARSPGRSRTARNRAERDGHLDPGPSRPHRLASFTQRERGGAGSSIEAYAHSPTRPGGVARALPCPRFQPRVPCYLTRQASPARTTISTSGPCCPTGRRRARHDGAVNISILP